MDDALSLPQILTRLGSAIVAGGLLGYEREIRHKPAGLRTHMMVALGAAVLMVIGLQFAMALAQVEGHLQIDPTRILEGVIGGVSFLGAGAIIQSRSSVRGLTTATSIWLSAAVGMACGLSYYTTAAAAVALGLIVLFVFGYFEQAVFDPEEPGNGDDSAPASTHQRLVPPSGRSAEPESSR